MLTTRGAGQILRKQATWCSSIYNLFWRLL